MPNFLTAFDWGNVPAYFGGLSLLLALRIFQRERTAKERSQVEQVGIWVSVRLSREHHFPSVFLTSHIKNASNLPVTVHYIHYEIITEWSKRVGEETLHVTRGKRTSEVGVGVGLVPPGSQEDHGEGIGLGVDDHSPGPGYEPDSPRPARAIIRYALVTDNAGRRWSVRPNRDTAKRVRWYSMLGARQRAGGHAWSRPIDYFIAWVRRAKLTALKPSVIRKRPWRINPADNRYQDW